MTARQEMQGSGARDPRPAMGDAFAQELPELGVPWRATRFERPELLVLNEGLARELGLDVDWLRGDDGLRFLLGEEPAPGSAPVAQAYAGHQFGVYVPRLGDGRALLLGELRDTAGRLRDVHLKGSGRTPFSRGGDGFAAVGPMLREYLMGEAMHALGIPTTRALAVVATGGRVLRDDSLDPLPGAVLVRVASSHLRVGTFQYARSRGDGALLRRLADFAIDRHLPGAAGRPDRVSRLLSVVVSSQARLIASWMLAGFVHGVMNTDNTAISGETIDYGPCAFIDAYDPAAVFSSIDHRGRYALGAQPGIVLWNLTRFAEALLPLLAAEAEAGIGVGVDPAAETGAGDAAGPVPSAGGDPGADHGADPAAGAAGSAAEGEPEGRGTTEDGASEAAKRLALDALDGFAAAYDGAWISGMRAKLGLAASGCADESVRALAAGLLGELQRHRIDYTGAFRALAAAARGDEAPLRDRYPDDAAPGGWLGEWLDLSPDPAAMDAVNPVYIPRNHLADEALAAATAGDAAPFSRLLEAVSRPFEARPGFDRYAEPAPAGSPRHITYCGT